MKIFQTYSSRLEAEMIQSKLKFFGVESQIKSDDMGGLNPSLTQFSGVQLLVKAEDYELACKLIKKEERIE